jgi:hypothetical protein
VLERFFSDPGNAHENAVLPHRQGERRYLVIM